MELQPDGPFVVSGVLYEPPPVPGVEFRTDPVAWHGPGREWVHPGRRAIVGDFKHERPEDCEREETSGVWIADGKLLICPDCGLDCT